jgi:hypothetical protein
MLHTEASLTVIIYDCKTSIVQANNGRKNFLRFFCGFLLIAAAHSGKCGISSGLRRDIERKWLRKNSLKGVSYFFHTFKFKCMWECLCVIRESEKVKESVRDSEKVRKWESERVGKWESEKEHTCVCVCVCVQGGACVKVCERVCMLGWECVCAVRQWEEERERSW